MTREILTTTLLPDDWREPVRYRIERSLSVSLITSDGVAFDYPVQPGFVTDGATVPRVFWSVFPPVGRYFLAAVAHDHALANGKGWPTSNAVFDAALRGAGVAAWRRFLMVNAVRLNGIYQHARHAIGLEARHVE